MPDPTARRDEGAAEAAFARPDRRPAHRGAPVRDRYGLWTVVTGASSGIGEALARGGAARASWRA